MVTLIFATSQGTNYDCVTNKTCVCKEPAMFAAEGVKGSTECMDKKGRPQKGGECYAGEKEPNPLSLSECLRFW